MREISSTNFGMLISFVLPGFASLWGAAYFSPAIRSWLVGSDVTGPTVGGFLYVTLASVAAGMTLSAIRFHVVDRLHHVSGVRQPKWDFRRLRDAVSAYKLLNEIHYKYYLFHGNGLIALTFVYFCRQATVRDWSIGLEDLAFLFLGFLFFATSRDNLQKYYSRVEQLLR